MIQNYEIKFANEMIPMMESKLQKLPRRLAFIIHTHSNTHIISPYKTIRNIDTLKGRQTCLTLEMNIDTFLRLVCNEITLGFGLRNGWIKPWPRDHQEIIALLNSLPEYFW